MRFAIHGHKKMSYVFWINIKYSSNLFHFRTANGVKTINFIR